MDSNDKVIQLPKKLSPEARNFAESYQQLSPEQKAIVVEAINMLATPSMEEEEFAKVREGLDALIGEEKRTAYEKHAFYIQRDSPLFWSAVEEQSSKDIDGIQLKLSTVDGVEVRIYHPDNSGIRVDSPLPYLVDEFIKSNEEDLPECFDELKRLRDEFLAYAEMLAEALNKKSRD